MSDSSLSQESIKLNPRLRGQIPGNLEIPNEISTNDSQPVQNEITITVTADEGPSPEPEPEPELSRPGSDGDRERDRDLRPKSDSPSRDLETASPTPGPTLPYYGRGRRASGVRLGSEERVRKISFGVGGVPRSGSWSLPKDEDRSDSEDSLLLVSSRRLSSFVLGPTLMGYNRRQWSNLMVFAVVDFCSAAVISLQAPFFPHEAISKGASSMAYAAVFCIYELTIFIMFPFFGKLLGSSSSKLLFNSGVFLTSISLIIFGCMSKINEVNVFIIFSMILRVLEGIGTAASITAKYSIISVEFPQNAAATFASLEKFHFLGTILAPPLGGILIQASGFTLAFTIFGALLFCSGLFTSCVMPSETDTASESHLTESFGGKIASLGPILKIPSVTLGFVCILAASCGVGFLNVLLEPHLSKWDYSPPIVASIFILSSGFYSLSASLWSRFREKVDNSKYVLLIGSTLILIGYTLIGPAPLTPIDTSPWLVCVGLVVHGIGLGASLVSGYMLALHDTIENGFADNVTTFGLVSAIFTSIFTFGQMLGNSSAGILFDQVGFRWGSSWILGFQAIFIVIILGFIMYDVCCAKQCGGLVHCQSFVIDLEDESDPLLKSAAQLDSRLETTIHEGQIFNPEVAYKKYMNT